MGRSCSVVAVNLYTKGNQSIVKEYEVKEYLVPIRFERTVIVETTVKIKAENETEATASVQSQIDKADLKGISQNIDNTDGIYEQFADHAESTVQYGEGVLNITINDETIEA